MIRERDGRRCQLCGMPESECLARFGRKLNVHHIDYNRRNNDPTNLISLCQACHAKTNGDRDYYREQLGQLAQH